MPLAGCIAGPRRFKGNLHGHTTASDGRLEAAACVRAYRAHGYDFIAISDHERFFDATDFDDDGFLVYPAIEFAVGKPRDGYKGHHLQGLAGTPAQLEAAGAEWLRHGQVLERLPWRGPHSVQRAADLLRRAGLMVVYNHPVWSRLEVEDLLDVSGLFAVEIYNHGSEQEDATGLATAHWDLLLRRGRRVYGLATDDNHNARPFDSPYSDSFGGWIVVDAPELTRAALAGSLQGGHFYSSTGPEIRTYGVQGREVRIACSPVRRIHFISYERRGSVAVAAAAESLTGACHTLKGDEVFVRVECIDAAGRVAWTNPIFLEDLPPG